MCGTVISSFDMHGMVLLFLKVTQIETISQIGADVHIYRRLTSRNFYHIEFRIAMIRDYAYIDVPGIFSKEYNNVICLT